MAWYDQIAKDPDRVLDEVAEWRGLSRDELNARRDRIHDAAGSGGPHLTLNEIDQFKNDNPQLSPAAIAHHEGCEYCQVLVDAIAPTTIEENKQKAIGLLAAVGLFSENAVSDTHEEPVMLSRIQGTPESTDKSTSYARGGGWFSKAASFASVAMVSVIGTLWFQDRNDLDGGDTVAAANVDEPDIFAPRIEESSPPESNDGQWASAEDFGGAARDAAGDIDLLGLGKKLAELKDDQTINWMIVESTISETGGRIVELHELPPDVVPLRQLTASHESAAENARLAIGNVVMLSEPEGGQPAGEQEAE